MIINIINIHMTELSLSFTLDEKDTAYFRLYNSMLNFNKITHNHYEATILQSHLFKHIILTFQ